MAVGNPWVLPGNGILGGITIRSAAPDMNDLETNDESPWARALREAIEAGTNPNRVTYAIPDRPLPVPLGRGSVSNLHGPPGASIPGAGQTFDLKEAIAPAQSASIYASKFAPSLRSGPPDNSGSLAMAQLGSGLSPSTFSKSPFASPLVPVAYQGTARPRPWWGPPPSVFDPWADHFIKGMGGLINFLSPPSTSSSGDDEEDCYTRWQRELENCKNPIGAFRNKRWLAACRQRANDRYTLCVKKGKPDPKEPPEYGLQDVPNDDPR